MARIRCPHCKGLKQCDCATCSKVGGRGRGWPRKGVCTVCGGTGWMFENPDGSITRTPRREA